MFKTLYEFILKNLIFLASKDNHLVLWLSLEMNWGAREYFILFVLDLAGADPRFPLGAHLVVGVGALTPDMARFRKKLYVKEKM